MSDNSNSNAQAPAQLARSRMDLIESTGKVCQLLGMPRSTGQIYGLLYLSPRPLSLDEIADLLAISKASASTGTRQLVAWQALREVWVPGDRRDYFEAVGDLAELARTAYRNFFQPKVKHSKGRLHHILEQLEEDRRSGAMDKQEYAFCRERLDQLGSIETKLQRVLPLLEKFL